MTDSELLAYMGTDAQRWAREWCRRASEIEARGDDVIDEGWMIGWFASAIETGRSAGWQAAMEQQNVEPGRQPCRSCEMDPCGCQ